MKSLILIAIGIVVGYFIGHPSSVAADTQVTYNSVGHKVVVATSDSSRNSTIAVGKECGESGYSLLGTAKENEAWVSTAECNQEESPPFSLSNLFK